MNTRSSSTRRKKRVSWTTKHDAILIDVWAKFAWQLRRPKRNGRVFAAMVEELKNRDVDMTAEEVKSKIRNLTVRYRTCNRKVKVSGGSPSDWEFFEKVGNIIQCSKRNDLSLVVESFDDKYVKYLDSLEGDEAGSAAGPSENISLIDDREESMDQYDDNDSSSGASSSSSFDGLNLIVETIRKSTDKFVEYIRESDARFTAELKRTNDLFEQMTKK